VNEGSSLGFCAPCRLDAHPHALELSLCPVAKHVVSEGGEEQAIARKPSDLYRGDRSTARRLLPGIDRLDDLARRGNMINRREPGPLDVADDGESHCSPGVARTSR
jgi:hypothetical protein